MNLAINIGIGGNAAIFKRSAIRRMTMGAFSRAEYTKGFSKALNLNNRSNMLKKYSV
jgi:hypothetical protein